MSNELITDIDEKLFEQIVEECYNGLPLNKACKKFNVKYKSFREFAQRSPERLLKLAHAEDACADVQASEIIDISDNETDQLRARNRIDARKWLASKYRPQKYGDRVDLNITKIVDIGGALAKAESRLLPIRDLIKGEINESLEIPASYKDLNSGSKPDNQEKPSDEKQPDKKQSPSIFD